MARPLAALCRMARGRAERRLFEFRSPPSPADQQQAGSATPEPPADRLQLAGQQAATMADGGGAAEPPAAKRARTTGDTGGGSSDVRTELGAELVHVASALGTMPFNMEEAWAGKLAHRAPAAAAGGSPAVGPPLRSLRVMQCNMLADAGTDDGAIARGLYYIYIYIKKKKARPSSGDLAAKRSADAGPGSEAWCGRRFHSDAVVGRVAVRLRSRPDQ